MHVIMYMSSDTAMQDVKMPTLTFSGNHGLTKHKFLEYMGVNLIKRINSLYKLEWIVILFEYMDYTFNMISIEI